MSATKLGPTLSLSEDENHESHSFWFENFKCSLKVDRRKDGEGLAITLKTPDAKVVVNLGPQADPHFVALVKHAGPWNDECEYAAEVRPNSAKFRLDYQPETGA